MDRHPVAQLFALLFAALLAAGPAAAVAEEEEYPKTLPPAEEAIRDTVDHWGLPFADQLRRFLSAKRAFDERLGPRAPKDFLVGIQHGLEKVARNKYWFKGRYGTSVSLEAARNECEGFQVAVLPDLGKSLKSVTLAAQDLRRRDGPGTIAAGNIAIYRVEYVKTVPAAYPSLYTGLWPDPLLPNAPVSVGGTDLGLFWIDVRVPRDAAPGRYQGRLLLAADGRSLPIDVSLRVYDFQLPDRVPFPLAVWTSPRWPSGEKMSDDEHHALAAEFLKHGVDPVSLGTADLPAGKDTDFSKLDRNLEFGFARGLQLFEIPNMASKPERLKPLVDHLRQKGWLQKAIVYSNQDEPSPAQFAARNVPFYRTMKSLFPDLRVYLASEYHPGIDQGCDIWMTDVSTGRGADFAQASHGKADLWFYYCHLPIHIDFVRPLVQAPNMLIDNEAIEHRLALWLAWKHQARGMFIWAGNRDWTVKGVDRKDWERKGWQLTEAVAKFPYGGIHNGNGFLLYPGPHPSIRLKVLRDGMEDYGYLLELRKRSQASTRQDLRAKAEAMLEVPPAVLVTAHYFNRDPEGLLKTRAEMAGLIEALGK